ncbi:UNVERIFIED_CONTAM: hypothetical protein GTU68_022376 [Idotea baltica]|nr:hypothetical protein [Idotea baltica]
MNDSKYASVINTYGRLYGVEPYYIRSIIAAESCFNPKAVSYKGAEGLMQLMPFTAKRFGVSNSFDERQNILGGVKYLSFLQERFKGDIELVTASYNAGEGAVGRYKGIPPFKETRNYVKKVMGFYAKMQNKNKVNIAKSLKINEGFIIKCRNDFKEKQHSYLELTKSTVRRIYSGPKTDNYSHISLKTGVPLSVIKRLNSNVGDSKIKKSTKKQKILLSICKF